MTEKIRIIQLFEAKQYEAAYQALEEAIKALKTFQTEALYTEAAQLILKAIVQALLFIINDSAGLDDEFLEYFHMLPETEQKKLTQDRRFHEGAQNLMKFLNEKGTNSESIQLIADKFHQKNPYRQN